MKQLVFFLRQRSAHTLLCLAAMLLSTPAALAQEEDEAEMSFDLEEAENADLAEEESVDMDFSEGGDSGGGGDLIGDLAGGGEVITEEEGQGIEEDEEIPEEIFAVQQIYALRINRVELAPSAAFSLNDPFVSHAAVGLGLNYWWTNVLAVGFNFLWYEGLEGESDLNFYLRRSTRLAIPVSQYQLGAHLNFTYVPLYGKFAMFNEYIFQWDAYIVGGVGMMRTRPIPVIDPEVRNFDYEMRIAFNVGLGIRVFVSRWLAVFGEIRNYMYLEELENLDVALGAQRGNSETWVQDGPAFTNNVSVHLGLTLFIPFEFDYQLPR